MLCSLRVCSCAVARTHLHRQQTICGVQDFWSCISRDSLVWSRATALAHCQAISPCLAVRRSPTLELFSSRPRAERETMALRTHHHHHHQLEELGDQANTTERARRRWDGLTHFAILPVMYSHCCVLIGRPGIVSRLYLSISLCSPLVIPSAAGRHQDHRRYS